MSIQEVSYYRRERKRPGRQIDLQPLPREKIPDILSASVSGQFPQIESALQQRGIGIKKLQIQEVLALVCAGLSQMARKDCGYPLAPPEEIRLIIDQYYCPEGSAQDKQEYDRMGFMVIYKDGHNFKGAIRMPGFKNGEYAGLPWLFDELNAQAHAPSFLDRDLFDGNSHKFTPLGNRLIDEMAHMISS